jgi:hypothetical protein
MNPADLAAVIEQIIISADNRYARAIGRVQNDLYNQIIAILRELELDDNGYIKQTTANRKILAQADDKIQEVFSSPMYRRSVSNFVAAVPKVDLQNVEYFTAIEQSFSPNRLFLKDLQKKAIKTIEEYILKDGLQVQVIRPLSQIMNQNINSGGQFSGFLQQIKDFVLGNSDVEGRALSYTRTFLRDSLFTYARTYQQSVTGDLGLEYYQYVGGLIDTSRPFCIERAGNFYHQKEVEQWAGLDWSGKKSGTTESSIFLFAGGWNCSHQIIPVHISIVPKEVIEHNKT